jgi:tRNA A-37 threonylcarbamoyl transferase component Bud32
VHEPQLMHEAKAAGVPTPLIYMVNVPESSIVMEYIEGQQVKLLLKLLKKTDDTIYVSKSANPSLASTNGV